MGTCKFRLADYSTESVTVYIVDGQYLRNNVYLDFTEGGNDQVYGGGPLSKADFIPQGEVWLESDGRTSEMMFSLVHELVERRLMLGGMAYEEAHIEANKREAALRIAPNTADAAIREELEAQEAETVIMDGVGLDDGTTDKEVIWPPPPGYKPDLITAR